MLVDVVELNVKGVRRPRAEWRNARPVRAELVMLKYFSWHGHENAPVFAQLRPYRLHSLDRAKVLHLAKRSIVIAGTQDCEGQRYEQVWWCRFVLSQAGADSSPADLRRLR